MNRRMIGLRRARSPTDTAVEVNSDSNAVRHRIARELNASLYRLTHQSRLSSSADQLIATESITEDQNSKFRNMEEAQLVKAVEALAAKYPELWKNAVNAASPNLEELTDLKEYDDEDLRVNPVLAKLYNWHRRVKTELSENTTLLASLRARKAALTEDRREVNRMVSMIVKISDENRSIEKSEFHPAVAAAVPASRIGHPRSANSAGGSGPGPSKRMRSGN